MYGQGAEDLSIQIQYVFNEHFSLLIFLKVFCRAKTSEVEMNCYL